MLTVPGPSQLAYLQQCRKRRSRLAQLPADMRQGLLEYFVFAATLVDQNYTVVDGQLVDSRQPGRIVATGLVGYYCLALVPNGLAVILSPVATTAQCYAADGTVRTVPVQSSLTTVPAGPWRDSFYRTHLIDNTLLLINVASSYLGRGWFRKTLLTTIHGKATLLTGSDRHLCLYDLVCRRRWTTIVIAARYYLADCVLDGTDLICTFDDRQAGCLSSQQVTARFPLAALPRIIYFDPGSQHCDCRPLQRRGRRHFRWSGSSPQNPAVLLSDL